jgi:hypothetical protein
LAKVFGSLLIDSIGKNWFILPAVVWIDAMRRKTLLYISGVLVVCIVTITCYFAFWTDKNVTVYDDHFKVLDYVISRGMNHTIYKGNQTTGRIRAMLKNRLGLKFINAPPAVMTIGPGNFESLVFFMFYEGDFPFKELNGLRAVLTNDKDIYKELGGGNLFIQPEQTFSGCYFLPALPASDDSFRIELKLYSPGEPVVSIRLGKIYRHYRGPKSGK